MNKRGGKMERPKIEKKKTNILLKVLIYMVLVIALATTFGIYTAKNYYKQALGPMEVDNPKAVQVIIPTATTTTAIADILHEKGLIKNTLIFRLQVKDKGVGASLKAGEYTLSTDMDLETIIINLIKGVKNRETTRFTIPEGFEIRQTADKLSEEGIVNKDKFLELVNNKANFQEEYPFLMELGENQSLEGFLFPSTYEIYLDSTEEEIIGKMLSEFEKIYNKKIKGRLEEVNLSLNEAITLASIVEREGKVDEERPLMSAVFHNRINQGMMLQSCATVQYILGERKENLTNEDTATPSPFNTYIHAGLPPAPIASPGEASLVAAVNPADVDYLFFVLTGDDGTHTFNKTYDGHLKAKPKK